MTTRNMLRNVVAVSAVFVFGGALAAAHDELGEPTAFGTGQQETWIGASEFTPLDPAGEYRRLLDYAWHLANETTLSHVTAQIDLPAGAHLSQISCVLYDNDPTPGATVAWHFEIGRSWFPSGTVVDTVHTSMSANYDDPDYHHTPHTVDHTIVYRDLPSWRFLYNLTVKLDSGNTDVRLWGCSLLWERTVSPAPVAASFSDVPTGHLFFQHIEALAASGITAGCGGGNYCPDDPVTRGQMAVFLAKALGLHWPY